MNFLMRAPLLLAMTLGGFLGMGTPSPAHAEPLVVRLAAVSDRVLVLPHDLTLTPDGQYLVVADMGQDRVVFLEPSTLALRHIIGEGVMSFPHDVTFDPQGRLLVADSGNDRVLVYTVQGVDVQRVETWDGLNGVEGITVTPEGHVYAALVEENRVVQLDQGKIIKSTGSALGMALDRPHDIQASVDVHGLSLIVADSANHRLVVFDGDLVPLYEISTWDPPFSEPKYLSVNEAGLIFVADQYNNRIRVFNTALEQQGQFANDDVKLPEGVFAQGGRIWISDTERGRVLLYQQDENH